MANKKIRDKMKERRLYHWQVADALGIHEATFCKHLRHELPDAEQERILKIIDDIRRNGNGVD